MSIEELSKAANKREQREEYDRVKEEYWETLRQLRLAVGDGVFDQLEGLANTNGGVSFRVQRKGLAGRLGLSRRLVVHYNLKNRDGKVIFPGLVLFWADGVIVPNFDFFDEESFLRAIERLR